VNLTETETETVKCKVCNKFADLDNGGFCCDECLDWWNKEVTRKKRKNYLAWHFR
jgi:predicted nucleic acid-binding Zn ribbon protein